jgi:2-octaprenyl-6-methoxyphenol hydroxylase
MTEIVVTDSVNPERPRPVLLAFGEADMGGGVSACMVENRHLYGAMLRKVLESPHIRLAVGRPVADYAFGPGLASLRLADGTILRACLVVAADGRKSPAREAAGIHLVGWPYDQMGLVATVEHELPHYGRADEHFTPSGPFAILPLPGQRSSLVWTERTGEAQRLLGLDDAAFAAELARRFGTARGAVLGVSGRQGYPLGMYLAENFTGPRLALAGDAAHVLHPLAGLGFNMGLRDVAALAECVADAAALGLDVGGAAVLERYARWRRFDTVATGFAMDGMNRLFANTNPLLTLFRRVGLLAVNRLDGLKQALVREAAGLGGDLPKLLRGEPL